ncbi:HMG-Y-related protein A-like [Nicotiana sylvestris]|nr:PREDICTED: HMG-Y-related protein A-like [Nicotiana sylvestris]
METEMFNKTPSSHPEYPEMIYEALEALNQEGGSNKSSMSKYIESKYGNLDQGHSKLLTFYLDKMKQNGELIFLKNNYIKPGPDVPPKRGRGRPRKDPNAPPIPKKPKPTAASIAPPPLVSKTGRPRGRPRKIKPQQQAQNGVEGS